MAKIVGKQVYCANLSHNLLNLRHKCKLLCPKLVVFASMTHILDNGYKTLSIFGTDNLKGLKKTIWHCSHWIESG